MERFSLYIVILALAFSCNNLSNDFFEFLFNSKEIRLDRECSNNPSIFSEGRYFEVYSTSNINVDLLLQNMMDTSKYSKNDKYLIYDIPKWNKTPVKDNDTVFAFISSELSDETNTCYSENDLIKILKQEENFYTFLYDDLGRVKLFIWGTKQQKLFLLTSYEL